MPSKIFISREKVENLLIKESLSKVETAKRLGITPATLSRICNEQGLDSHPRHWKNDKRRKYLNQIMPKEWFILEYVEKNRTANDLANELSVREGFPFYASCIISQCKKYGIKTKSYSESALQCLPQKRSSYLKSLGVDNPSKSEAVKQKKIEKSLEKYGTINVFQAEEIKEKSRATMMRRFGVPHLAYLPGWKENIWGNGRTSKLQLEIETILDEHSITYESEVRGRFLKFNSFLQKDYCPRVDILLEKEKMVIEVYGDVWHANPQKYKPNDQIILYDGPTKAIDIWAFDSSRIEQIKSFGYTVLVLWEAEIHSNKQKIEERIINEINKNKVNY